MRVQVVGWRREKAGEGDCVGGGGDWQWCSGEVRVRPVRPVRPRRPREVMRVA